MAEKDLNNSFVLCIDDGGYPESLEVRKVYVAITDEKAQSHQFVRVIDETGEDYLYPQTLFVPIQIPPEAVRVIAISGASTSRGGDTQRPHK